MLPDQLIPENSVLIVDDDVAALEEMTEAMRDRNLTVHAAANSATAILMAAEHKPSFILMDYKLPDVNGLETVSSIRRFLPDAIIVMMSVVDDFCELATIQNTQTDGILRKPLPISSIARFIQARLN